MVKSESKGVEAIPEPEPHRKYPVSSFKLVDRCLFLRAVTLVKP